MSLCTPTSGLGLHSAVSSSSPQCSTSGCKLQAFVKPAVIHPLAADLAGLGAGRSGAARGGREVRGIGRDCGRLYGGKVSRIRAGFRVRCQVGGGSNLAVEYWTRKLPAKRKALYSHSLPCIEAWLQSLGFVQGKEDRAVWTIERPDWHAQLSLDVTDLYIRYLRKGPGKLERDIERKFSYALSREDLENAILGGP